MNKVGKSRKTILFVYLTAIHLCLILLIVDKFFPFYRENKPEVSGVVPIPSPIQIPYEANTLPLDKPAENSSQNQINSNQATVVTNQNSNSQIVVVPQISDKLMIPVVGIKKESLQDTYNDARSENRVHNAIDIIAPLGTPVVAVADGEIARFFDSELGGITIYQFSKDKKYIYYYAHLQKRAENLPDKGFVSQGTIIGYVGDTGNAGAGNYHLHFSISVPSDPKRYWEGENVNPFPLLKDGVEAQIR